MARRVFVLADALAYQLQIVLQPVVAELHALARGRVLRGRRYQRLHTRDFVVDARQPFALGVIVARPRGLGR